MAVFLSGFISNEVMAHLAPARLPRTRTSPTTRRPPSRRSWRRGKAWLAEQSRATDHDRPGRRPHRPPPRRRRHRPRRHRQRLRRWRAAPRRPQDVAGFPRLIGELLRRGYSDDDVRKIAGGNVLRVMRGAEAVAARLQAERAPSEATIEELDGPLLTRRGGRDRWPNPTRWLSRGQSARCGWSSPPTTTRRPSASTATSSGSRSGLVLLARRPRLDPRGRPGDARDRRSGSGRVHRPGRGRSAGRRPHPGRLRGRRLAGETAVLAAGGATVIAEPTRTPWETMNARLEGPGGLH